MPKFCKPLRIIFFVIIKEISWYSESFKIMFTLLSIRYFWLKKKNHNIWCTTYQRPLFRIANWMFRAYGALSKNKYNQVKKILIFHFDMSWIFAFANCVVYDSAALFFMLSWQRISMCNCFILCENLYRSLKNLQSYNM